MRGGSVSGSAPSTCVTATACTAGWTGVRCPVLRMHGTADPVYSVANAEDEIQLFVNSADAELRVVDGGHTS